MLFLNEVAPDLWTASQSFRFGGIEIGCRMTIVRLPSQELVLISPIALKHGDRKTLDALGTVKHLIAPNLFHHLYFGAVQAIYPEAKAWGVLGLSQKRPDLKFDVLLDHPGNFENTLAYLPFAGFGSILPSGIKTAQETVFWHQPSGTLILTDIAFNFDETFPFTTRLAAQILGTYNTLRPSRLEQWGTFDKAAVEASIRQVLTWDFDRVIPGHGSIVETNGKAQLKAGYEWFLGRSL
jgi:hypothetical protein